MGTKAKGKRYPAGPWRGTQDASQPYARAQDEAFLLQNCFLLDQDSGGPLVIGRPGMTYVATQLGSSGKRTGQRSVQFTKRAGTEYTVFIVGGEMWTYNWSANTVTQVITTANLTSASITLSATAKVYCATFADNLVVSDGVNVPFAWDGTTNGGLTKLTNCPVLYGQPVVYYGKLFGIKASARQTIVWSEEGVLNTGYEAGGYNNAWDLIQTHTEGLEALAASNEALYFARANSIGAIEGAVTTDFQVTGTRARVSEDHGTQSPAAFKMLNNKLVFVNEHGHPCFGNMSGVQEVGLGARQLLETVPASALSAIEMVDDVEFNAVRFAMPGSGQSVPTMMVCVDRDTGRYIGVHTGYQCTTVDLVKDANKVETIVHLGGDDPLASADGYAHRHGHLMDTLWDDTFVALTASISHAVTTDHLGYDTDLEKLFTRGSLSTTLPTTLTGLQVTRVTPEGTSTPLTLATLTGGGAQYEVAVYGVDSYGGEAGERKVSWTMRERGRWCRLLFAHATEGERFDLSHVAVEAMPVSSRVGAM